MTSKRQTNEASYRPGVTKLRREISFNDLDQNGENFSGEEDYNTVKQIRWPSGIDVKFDDRNRTVTFYTAKMKTVAKLLNKYIDFGAVSAGEILDLPPALMGEADELDLKGGDGNPPMPNSKSHEYSDFKSKAARDSYKKDTAHLTTGQAVTFKPYGIYPFTSKAGKPTKAFPESNIVSGTISDVNYDDVTIKLDKPITMRSGNNKRVIDTVDVPGRKVNAAIEEAVEIDEANAPKRDIVDFSMFAGMYSDGARTAMQDRNGKWRKISATGDSPRTYFLDGKEIEWDKLKNFAGGKQLNRFEQGREETYEATDNMTEATDEKALANIKRYFESIIAKELRTWHGNKNMEMGLERSRRKGLHIIDRLVKMGDVHALYSADTTLQNDIEYAFSRAGDDIDNYLDTAMESVDESDEGAYSVGDTVTYKKAQYGSMRDFKGNKKITSRIKQIITRKGQPPRYELENGAFIKQNDLITKAVDESAGTQYGVFSKGGSIGSDNTKPVATFDKKEDAIAKAKRMRKLLSPGERSYYKMSYVVRPIKEEAKPMKKSKDSKEGVAETQLDELGRDTLRSYKRKATDDMRYLPRDAQDSYFHADSEERAAKAPYRPTSYGVHKQTDDEKEAGLARAKRTRAHARDAERKMRNRATGLSRASKRLYGESQINEGVLDDMDDDGFMAKRQLYDIAKAAVALHRMIQDTDNLEPWISAKITTAEDYISTVKQYLEYEGVNDAEDMAAELGFNDMADIETALEPEYVATEDLMAEDDEGGEYLDALTVLRMAFTRKIISQEQFYNPSDELYAAADNFAMDLGEVYELGSSDVSIYMKQFVEELRYASIPMEGENAHLYESEIKARKIYEKMTKALRGK